MTHHHLGIQESLDSLSSSIEGISDEEAGKRIEKYGHNELVEQAKRGPIKIFFDQLTATMQLILLGAALISVFLGSYKDAIAIFSIVILFAILGFIQEYRAEKSMAALKKLAVPFVKVIRHGKLKEIPSINLVPGDIVSLEAGNIIPADCRLIESVALKVQEAALTGESVPVEKDAKAVCKEDDALADRITCVYMGTIISQGRAKAVVTSTGMNTELGKIASVLQEVKQEATPLQKRLDSVGKKVALLGIAISIIIIIFGLIRGDSFTFLLLSGISVAVAVIPEGLPAVVTITLAIGAQRMLKRKALIRKLPAVETLGSVTVICSDKTGTLTENKMAVVNIDTMDEKVDLTRSKPQKSSLIMSALALCNDAKLDGKGFIGDPTEGALLIAAADMNIYKEEYEKCLPRVLEVPFDSERKRMSTLHEINDKDLLKSIGLEPKTRYISLMKGAVDGIVHIADKVFIAGKEYRLTDELRKDLLDSNERLAGEGKRVLGSAYKFVDTEDVSDVEKEVVFIGMVAMIDPPRQEVKESVEKCKQAGIRTVMITGDHPLTAKSIASQLGILGSGKVITGKELDNLSEDGLKELVGKVSVYARVSPEHKLRIIQALQMSGQVVAMTGDGVNDAPALKKADIGVAMGITGTDVSKEASDMVLLDDNFKTIVSAAEEGRIVFDNIKKFVKFSLAGNIGKIIVMLFGPVIWASLPLFPIQLLWLNLLTDGLLGLGLGMEKAESHIMKRPPIKPKEGVFSNGGWMQVTVVGILVGVISIGIGAFYFFKGSDAWQTMIFLTIAFCQVWQVLAVRTERDLSIGKSLFGNKTLISMVSVVILLQIAALYIPYLQSFLQLKSIGFIDLSVAFFSGIVLFIVVEIMKKK